MLHESGLSESRLMFVMFCLMLLFEPSTGKLQW